jgi:hypothetical protein
MHEYASHITCPLCGKYAIVYAITPDVALLDMLIHFMRSHSDASPLTLLDMVELDTTKGLIPNGVGT